MGAQPAERQRRLRPGREGHLGTGGEPLDRPSRPPPAPAASRAARSRRGRGRRGPCAAPKRCRGAGSTTFSRLGSGLARATPTSRRHRLDRLQRGDDRGDQQRRIVVLVAEDQRLERPRIRRRPLLDQDRLAVAGGGLEQDGRGGGRLAAWRAVAAAAPGRSGESRVAGGTAPALAPSLRPRVRLLDVGGQAVALGLVLLRGQDAGVQQRFEFGQRVDAVLLGGGGGDVVIALLEVWLTEPAIAASVNGRLLSPGIQLTYPINPRAISRAPSAAAPTIAIRRPLRVSQARKRCTSTTVRSGAR